ncbi:MAG: glycosyl transferase family 90 [Pseudomonadota bacterium]
MTIEEEPLKRVGYFIDALAHHVTPYALKARHAAQVLAIPLDAEAEARVAYYAKPSIQATKELHQHLGDISYKDGSLYAIDFFRAAKGFGNEFAFNALFGDITEIPKVPTFVKSRPVHGANENAVLLPLNRLRHFRFPDDPIPWAEKRPSAVWRGRIHSPDRMALIKAFHDHPRHDIGAVQARKGAPPQKDWLRYADQMRHRYVLSLEGFDVATNLKWAMCSNSLVLSPRLKYETWFMEGQLIPGVHFAEIAPDGADLDDVVAHFEANPDAAQQIIANAHAWVDKFRDPRRERMLAIHVVARYRRLTTGQ